MKRIIALSIITLFTSILFAQSAQTAFEFLELPYSAHNAALGGTNAALTQDGINGAMANPSLLSNETDNQLAINYSRHLSDVSAGSVAYGKNFGENMFGAGVQYLNYGSFEGKDENDISTGTFSAKDFALLLLYARQLSTNWQAGLTFKPIYSAYETYTSFGLAVDLGARYINEKEGICLGFAMTNIGQQLTGYYDQVYALPFNSMITFSKRFEHAPIRLCITAHHLHVWDLKYDNTITTTNLSGEAVTKNISFADMLFRHFIFGVDLTPGENFYLSVSYNHRRAQELALDDMKTMSGFSFGGGLKLKKFHLDFAASEYQTGIWTYEFTVSTNLNSFNL